MEDLLILVDENDRETDYATKDMIHRLGLLHRAFSVLLFNVRNNKILIQKRASGKYHSGGLWTNSCCSHPRKGESLLDAVKRRIQEELGVVLSTTLVGEVQELGTFRYFAEFENCCENEIDHVFWINVDLGPDELFPDPNEIEDIRWISMKELALWLEYRPEDFTVWFPKVFLLVKSYYERRE